ncbi:hypothetical protein HA397_28100, partial [Escherichia coli]|nr:hypothetical protein [Escherichia coli]
RTAEWADLGRALEWGRDTKRPDIAIDPLLALHIHLLWQLRIEGFSWLDAGVESCGVTEDRRASVKLLQSMGRWSAGDLERSEKLLEEAVESGGETLETTYFRFYQAFAREDYAKVYETSEISGAMVAERGDPAWQTTVTAFRVVGHTMRDPSDPNIDALLEKLDGLLGTFDWPSGHCCALLARLTNAFLRGDAALGEEYRRRLDT